MEDMVLSGSLLEEVREAHTLWLEALTLFDDAEGQAQTEFTVMQAEAARMRYDYLLRRCKLIADPIEK